MEKGVVADGGKSASSAKQPALHPPTHYASLPTGAIARGALANTRNHVHTKSDDVLWLIRRVLRPQDNADPMLTLDNGCVAHTYMKIERNVVEGCDVCFSFTLPRGIIILIARKTLLRNK